MVDKTYTRAILAGGKDQFWKEYVVKKSGWCDNPTDAFKVLNLDNPKFKKKQRGALLAGITYPNVQAKVREVFPSGYQSLIEDNERFYEKLNFFRVMNWKGELFIIPKF